MQVHAVRAPRRAAPLRPPPHPHPLPPRRTQIDDVLVCDNLGDHLIGNVYIKFFDEEDTAKALAALNGRWYGGRQVKAEYSPVTEFREARCRQFDEQGCARGPWCNFMHLKGIP